jgi:hypothetical protein
MTRCAFALQAKGFLLYEPQDSFLLQKVLHAHSRQIRAGPSKCSQQIRMKCKLLRARESRCVCSFVQGSKVHLVPTMRRNAETRGKGTS